MLMRISLIAVVALGLAGQVRAADPPVSPKAAPPADPVASFRVDDFGAKGDGAANDLPAILKAVAAATSTGKPAAIVFTRGKTYYEAADPDNPGIKLKDATDITIDGNGAMLLLEAPDAGVTMDHCTRCAVRGVTIDYKHLPYTQGVITAVDTVNTAFDMTLEAGYDDPDPSQAGTWLSVLGPKGIALKPGVADFMYIDSATPIDPAQRSYRIKFHKPIWGDFTKVAPGDRTFLATPAGKITHFAAVFPIMNSSDIAIELTTVYSSPRLSVWLFHNEGPLRFDNFQIRIRPGTDRVMSSRSDGIHCKFDRIGPVVENCFFEGLMDDSMNIGESGQAISEVVSPTDIKLPIAQTYMAAGDRLEFYDTLSGAVLGTARIATATLHPPLVEFTLDTPISGMSAEKNGNFARTVVFNADRAGSGFVVRNCTFKPQRHDAALVYAPHGILENNMIDGGHGFILGNALWCNEGPIPGDIVIRGNRFNQSEGIQITADCTQPSTRPVENIVLEDNRFANGVRTSLLLSNVQHLVIRNMSIVDNDGALRDYPPISLDNCSDIEFDPPLAICDQSNRLPCLASFAHMTPADIASVRLDWNKVTVKAALSPSRYQQVK